MEAALIQHFYDQRKVGKYLRHKRNALLLDLESVISIQYIKYYLNFYSKLLAFIKKRPTYKWNEFRSPCEL